MSFALVRGYHDPAFVAGLRLAVVPVALGVTAPFAGALSDKRPRLVMLFGMGLCLASALALTRLLTGTPDSLPGVMTGLGVFGVGLGFFIAPNNNATMGAAPAEPSGVAGGLLMLLAGFGSGLGVAFASATLALGLERAAGTHGRTTGASEAVLLAAVSDVLILLAALAAIGAATALVMRRRQAGSVGA